MLCYKGKTFCTFYTNCRDGETCFRSLTPDVKQSAKVWWGGEAAPVAVFIEEPGCFRPKEASDEVQM